MPGAVDHWKAEGVLVGDEVVADAGSQDVMVEDEDVRLGSSEFDTDVLEGAEGTAGVLEGKSTLLDVVLADVEALTTVSIVVEEVSKAIGPASSIGEVASVPVGSTRTDDSVKIMVVEDNITASAESSKSSRIPDHTSA